MVVERTKSIDATALLTCLKIASTFLYLFSQHRFYSFSVFPLIKNSRRAARTVSAVDYSEKIRVSQNHNKCSIRNSNENSGIHNSTVEWEKSNNNQCRKNMLMLWRQRQRKHTSEPAYMENLSEIGRTYFFGQVIDIHNFSYCFRWAFPLNQLECFGCLLSVSHASANCIQFMLTACTAIFFVHFVCSSRSLYHRISCYWFLVIALPLLDFPRKLCRTCNTLCFTLFASTQFFF